MTKHTLARWLFPFGAIRLVFFGVCRGMRYEVGPGIGATFCLGGEAFHHRFYQRVIRPGMHVWDLGANTGQSLLALGRLVGPTGSVNAFEPVRELADLADRQARLNSLNHVQVHCLAVSEQDGSLEFDFSAEVPTQGKLRQVEHDYRIADSKRRMVEAVSLDSFAMVNRLPGRISSKLTWKVRAQPCSGVLGARWATTGRSSSSSCMARKSSRRSKICRPLATRSER